MKTAQKLALLLSLVAIAHSYAAESSNKTKRSETIDCSHFRGVQNRIVFVDNRHHGAGDGSCAHPFPTLEEAELHSQPGQCIYVMATGHPYRGSVGIGRGAVIALKPNQCCVSSGCTLKIGDKEIPALTPGHIAEICVGGAGPTTGILMSNCNQVAGFLFNGTAAGSEPGSMGPLVGIGSVSFEGTGRHCSIANNQFQHLDHGVRLPIQPCSDLDLLSNRFSSIRDTHVDLQTAECITVTIRNNSFEGEALHYVCCDPTPLADPERELNRGGQSVPLSKEERIGMGEPSFFSDGATLCIEKNKFIGHADEAFFAQGAKQLDFRQNHISGGVKIGFEGIQYTRGESTLCIEDNEFDVIERNICSLGNVNATVRRNIFRGGSYGFGIFTFTGGGIAASIDSNTFENQSGNGFCMDLLDPRFPSCLRLLNNKSHKPFAHNNWDNHSTLFQVAAQSSDHLTTLNHGTTCAVDGEVSFVPRCLRCAE